jgi:hypothetical protein
LFISGTQWIDAFAGRVGAHVDRLVNLLAEEEGRVEPGEPEPGRPDPRVLPKWAVPIGAAAALLVLGAGFSFWSDSLERAYPGLMIKPVWFPKTSGQPEEQIASAEKIPDLAVMEKSAGDARAELPGETEMIVGGKSERANSDYALAAPANDVSAGQPDFRACEKSSGDDGIAACDRAIASGKFTGRNLSYLYSDRGFMRMLKGDVDRALADLNEAARIDSSNFYAFWNRGAVYAARGDLKRAQEDFTAALALNPDMTSKAKIEEAMNAVNARAAQAAQSQASDPSVITDPSKLWGPQEGLAGSAASSYPADTATMPASPAEGPDWQAPAEAPPGISTFH